MNEKHPLIYLDNLCKTYHLGHETIHALQHIDLKIHSGHSLAIMGPSGSGKSTLLHLLGCLDRPSEGHYFLDNQNVSLLSDDELASHRASRIGFVFQSFNLIPYLNVFENVEAPFIYQHSRLSNGEIHQRIMEALQKVKLDHRLSHLPSQLSGGEMQRVAIARALAIHPLLIIADEPTGNLDTQTGKIILQLFQDLNLEGTTLIIATHDEQVSAYCHSVIYMQDGKIKNKKS